MVAEQDDDSWGVSAFLWAVVAGGRQCCSMRDRSEVEAAKQAAETGRPPTRSRFPEPTGKGQQPFTATFGTAPVRDRPAAPVRDRGTLSPSPHVPPLFLPSRDEAAAPPSWDESSRPPSPPSPPPLRPMSPLESRPGPFPRSGSHVLDVLDDTRPDADFQPPSQRGAAVASTKPLTPASTPVPAPSYPSPKPEAQTPGRLPLPEDPLEATRLVKESPGRWEWPGWCLNFKSPCIEVYVVDEDTHRGRWVKGDPQSRVVDRAGRDAYLCVEYEWDGEYYVQDFGPQHVRKRGDSVTVMEVFEKATEKKKDLGCGMGPFLEDSM